MSDGNAVVARSRSLVAESLPTGGLGETRPIEGPRGESLLALSLPVRGADDLSVTVAGPKSAIDRALLNDLWIVVGSVVTLGLMLMLVVWSQVNRALRPLRHLAEDLGRLRTGVLAEVPPSRFSELNTVVTLVNGLLADSRDLVAHARDTAAKLAHGLKTPLAVLAARFGTGGANQDPKVTDAVDSMRRLIDQNSRWRVPPAHRRLSPIRSRCGRSSRTSSSPSVMSSVSAGWSPTWIFRRMQHFGEIGTICRRCWATSSRMPMPGRQSRVRVSAGRNESGELTIAVSDDGPGFPDSIVVALAPDDSSSLADNAARPAPSNGLGLRITRDIAARYRGRLELANLTERGAIATLRLP